jgi:protein-glutamine gamma-glutamyltransferase
MQVSPANSNLLQPSKYVRLRPQQLNQGNSDLNRRRGGALLMAAAAMATLIQRRSSYDSGLFIVIELVICAGAIAVASWCYRGGQRSQSGIARWRRPAVVLLLGLALVGPWLLNVVAKSQGYGNGLEIVMLSSLSWVGLMAAGVGTQSRTISLSVVCNGFVALFATLISDSSVATWFAYTWVALCMWWLVGNHWEEINTQVADQLEFSRGLRWSYILLGLAVFSGSVLLLGNRIPVWHKLQAEIMPTSGGTSAKDDAARSGVGNGDTLIAAKRHATSFGAVESDIFLDSEKPSLFDVFSDEFGLPKPKDKVERAQALKPQEDQGADGKSSEANRSTQSNNFSVNRQPPRYKEPPADLVSSALLFWEGEAGAHLAVERFHRFEGQIWTQADHSLPLESTYPESIEIEDRTWFYAPGNKFASSLSPYRGAMAEAIKFTRFRSPVIPSRAGGMLWSIDQLTRADFFSYAPDDCLSMVGREHVPDYTVVRFVNGQLDLEKMDQLLRHCSPGTGHRMDSAECQGCHCATRASILAPAFARLVAGLCSGRRLAT